MEKAIQEPIRVLFMSRRRVQKPKSIRRGIYPGGRKGRLK
jgi:hypothetical protein